MKNFRTEIFPDKPGFSISYADSILTLGSCFTEHMGAGFKKHKFNTLVNPFGQLYNPASMSKCIGRMLNPFPYQLNDLVYHDGLYHSFDHHSRYSGEDAALVLEKLNQDLSDSSYFLKNTGVLILTFGTAHVFRKKKDGEVVANCHKIPQKEFEYGMLSSGEIASSIGNSLEGIRKVNPKVKIILTISPVRYFSFGAFDNHLSKGQLFAAVHQLLADDKSLYYFPAYEMVTDDLRDYRFYAEDMLHPNYLATAYVWEKLVQTFIGSEDRKRMDEVAEIVRAASHKPRKPDSEAHRKFTEKYLEKIKMYKALGLDFGEEEKLFKV